MKNTSLLVLFILATIQSYSQKEYDPDFEEKTIQVNSYKVSSKTVKLDQVVKGIGPIGNSSMGIASRDLIPEEELKAYPQMKNLPDSLANLKEYLFILNDFQFYYQNYKKGIYSKELFFKKARGFGRNLNDTLSLTDQMVKNTISVVAGYAADSTIVYIVDANNNDDYSDDRPRTLLSDLHKEDDVVANAESVTVEYYDGTSIQKESQLVTITKSLSPDLFIVFKFPQYRYGKATFGEKDYLIVAESVNFNQSIYFVEDRPFFERLDRKYLINPSQYLKIDDIYVQYTPVSQNLDEIKLSISSNDQESQKIPTTNQVGMFAPEISGINILDDSKISLEKYKGKYVFLDFWSTACPPCFIEFPNITEVYEKFSEEEIAIIGIADIRGNVDIEKFLEDKNVSWANIDEKASSTSTKGYRVKSWPTTYLIDPDGKVIATNLRGNDLNNKLELLNITKK